MKKVFKVLTLGLILTFVISCEKAEDSQLLNKPNEITAKEIGEYHNTALRKVEDRFQELINKQGYLRTSASGPYSGYTYAEINQAETDEIHGFLNEVEPEFVVDQAEILDAVTITNNNFLTNQDLASLNLVKINDLKNKLNVLVSENKILDSEKALIIRLLDLTYFCDFNKDYSTFQSELDSIISDKNSIQWVGENGKFIDYGIEIAQNSYYYWLDDAITTKPTLGTNALLPLWVGMDVVGALAGGGSSMWSQRNNKKFDWYEIGGQTLIWGVAGSITGSSRFLKLFR